jgi:hypothetical protein
MQLEALVGCTGIGYILRRAQQNVALKPTPLQSTQIEIELNNAM